PWRPPGSCICPYTTLFRSGGVVQDEHGRLLAIRRLGMWDLPKGKVDPGEAIDGAALREVREECGVQQLALVRPIAHTWHTYVREDRKSTRLNSSHVKISYA